jgi:hypothetical protein
MSVRMAPDSKLCGWYPNASSPKSPYRSHPARPKPDPLRPFDLADGGDLYVRVETSGTVVFWLRYQLNGRRRR